MRKPGSSLTRRLLVPLVVIGLSLFIILAVREIAAVRRINDAVHTVSGMMQGSAGGSGQFEQLDLAFSQAMQDYAELRWFIGPAASLAPLFSWLPRYGDTLADAPVLLEFADRGLISARDALTMGRFLNAMIDAPGQVSPGEVLLQYTGTHATEIAEAQRHLSEVQQVRARLRIERFSPAIRDLVQRADRLLELWQTTLQGLTWAPELLGQGHPRLYLLLAQNSDELRATGGFISGVGLIRVSRGELTVLDFRDSFAVDDLSKPHPAPPAALQKYMYAGMWVLRDANWSPDFPTAARAAMDLYTIDQAIQVDGVIAVNLQIVPRILNGLGPVTLDTGEIITAENAIGKFQTLWSARGQATEAQWWEHRKDFMGKFLEQLLVRMRSGAFDRVRLARAVYDSLEAKDLLLYANAIPEGALANLPWSGRLYRGPGDALMIVDSNLGFNKVDGHIQRQADYTVRLSGGEVRSTLSITYTNLSSPNRGACVLQAVYPPTYSELQQGCYWNYVRVATPLGTSLLQAAPDFLVQEEPIGGEGRAMFGGYLVVPWAESRNVQFEYLLPPIAKDASRYVLHLEKQPGAPPLMLKVHIYYDESMRIRSSAPAPIRAQGSLVEFEIKLDRDQEIDLLLEPNAPSLAPWFFALAALFTGGTAWFLHRRRNPAVH